MKKKTTTKPANQLWTRDFTIITLGSVVSMLGNDAAGFAMSLLVLDYTGSSFYYAVYLAVYLLPSIFVPILSGPFLDRFSRKRAIWTLDFCSAGLYALLALMLGLGKFNFALFALATFIMGCIDGVYSVAYESFYPLLISAGCFTKAYSISSTLETMTFVMMPISAFVYNTVGIVWLFAFNALTFLVAALFELQIKTTEQYVADRASETLEKTKNVARQFASDFRQGIRFLLSEPGLLAVTAYFTVSSLFGGVSNAIDLPYFKNTFSNGEYVFTIVWGMCTVGRMIGGALHYKIKFPTEGKYAIALGVYIITSLLDGAYLYFPIPVMMGMTFMTGILGVTSYNIRISATQSYVADEKKGRFNGIFNTLMTTGALLGQLAGGALATVLPPRAVISGFALVTALAAIVFIGGNKKAVSKIYNTQA